jgi:aminoglycoside phosphotransferase family enzyme
MELDFKNADKVIETLLSRIFFFGETVYKFYKWEKAFYGDLSDAGFRKKFIEEDFVWNKIMSPKIYRELVILKNEEEVEDLCIVMNKLKSQENFTDCIESGKINSEIIRRFVKNLIERQRSITDFKKDELGDLLSADLKKIEMSAIKDLQDWCYLAGELPKAKTDLVVKKLIAILEKEEYELWCKAAIKKASIDGNGDNFIFQNGEFVFIDILPPKHSWRVEDEVFNLGRVAADIRALSPRSDLADLIYESYEAESGLKVLEEVKKLYEARGAMIQTAYRYILGQPSRAEKYLKLAEAILGSL